MASLMYRNDNAKYNEINNQILPPVSTCSPTSRDACNGGQCILMNGGVYTCRCREGYTGVYCENS